MVSEDYVSRSVEPLSEKEIDELVKFVAETSIPLADMSDWYDSMHKEDRKFQVGDRVRRIKDGAGCVTFTNRTTGTVTEIDSFCKTIRVADDTGTSFWYSENQLELIEEDNEVKNNAIEVVNPVLIKPIVYTSGDQVHVIDKNSKYFNLIGTVLSVIPADERDKNTYLKLRINGETATLKQSQVTPPLDNLEGTRIMIDGEGNVYEAGKPVDKTVTSDKYDRHKQLCDQTHETYIQKNKAYGDSFGNMYKELGIISAVTRIGDKYNRLKNLALHPDVNKGDESIIDTLMDMANYCLMTVMEVQEGQ